MNKHTFLDSKIYHFLSKMADLIILNLLFILCCLPIITIGAAQTALFYVTLRMTRNEEAHVAEDFLRSFRKNLKQGIAVHLIFSAVTIILCFDVYVLWKLMEISWIFKYLLIIVILISALHFVTSIYVYPVLAQFENTVRNTIKNARYMALKHFSFSLAMSLVALFPFFCAWIMKYFLEWEILVFLLFGFALMAYINSVLLAKVFDKYIPQNTDA